MKKQFLITFFLVAFSFWMNSFVLAQDMPHSQTVQVKDVIDGDTLILQDNRTVRLIGVDCPEFFGEEKNLAESYDQNLALPQYKDYAQKSKEYVKEAVLGKEIVIEEDPVLEPVENEDLLGRTKAYIYVNGQLLNENLIKNGYCYTYDKSGRFKHRNRFNELEAAAKQRKLGIWNQAAGDALEQPVSQK